MKRLLKKFRYGERGFTLIELLVVVAIIGILAAVAVPNVGRFISRGETESYAAELHNVQTAVIAMIADSGQSELDKKYGATDDMSTIKAGSKKLSDYLTGLDDDDKIKSGCTYAFKKDGTVTQTPPQ